jgi:hypothetical protein
MTLGQQLLDELKKGGKQAPCPFCRIPRVQRSDYIRCCRCGINWLAGEALDKDPRNERMRLMIESATSTAPKKNKEENGGR